ncbi:histidine--tRNA ligase [Magnetococcales bacterium HHB-1]
MSKIKPERPGGFLDFLPSEYLIREKLIETIREVFHSFGYDPIETPMIEFEKVLAGEKSDTGKNIFRIAKSDEKSEKLALRFDQTVPFARLLAANPYNKRGKTGIRLPWRRMVVGPVFRGESPQSGRYRQFYQFDIDIAGTTSMLADAEIVAVMQQTMKALQIDRYTIRLNHRKILNGLIKDLLNIKARASLSADDIAVQVIRILDKVEKITPKTFHHELTKPALDDFDPAPQLEASAVQLLNQFIQISGDNQEKLAQAEKLLNASPHALEGVEELRQILTSITSEAHIEIDFSIARGLDYYTGPVMELGLLDAPEFGSVFSGGRYNDLVSRFTGGELPAVGASIGVDRLFAALKSLSALPEARHITDVMVLRLCRGRESEYIAVAEKIRACGFNVELSLEDDLTFKSQFYNAINRNAHFAVIMGEAEFEKETVQVKNLQTRKQEEMPLEAIKAFFLQIKSA